MKEALEALLIKYNISVDSRFMIEQEDGAFCAEHLLPGYEAGDLIANKGGVPLLYWRMRRSFMELKDVIAGGVIGKICLQKSNIISSAGKRSLAEVVYREADLCEYLGDGTIRSVFAVWNNENTVNVIARMSTKALCSWEISLNMPGDVDDQEVHEIVGSRGVTSDRAVDCQLSQSSLYCFTQSGNESYTDSDAELFGFNSTQVEQIRAAFEIYKNPALLEKWENQHRHLVKVVEAVVASGKERRRVLIA